MTCWHDVLVWESENTLVDGPLVQYVHICALKGISASDWVAYCTQLRMIWLVITYGAICPRLLPDWIAYCTSMSRLHINPYGYAHPPWTIHPVYFQFQFHMRRSRMIFSQSSMCASTLSQHIYNDFWLNYYSTFLFSSYLNLTSTFIFALIILYWFNVNVRPWLQRHFTFDMLLHIEHWLLWWVTVIMYGRFHQ